MNQEQLDLTFYTVKGVATMLSMSASNVWDLMAKGDLRSYKIRGARRISRRDLEDFLKRCNGAV